MYLFSGRLKFNSTSVLRHHQVKTDFYLLMILWMAKIFQDFLVIFLMSKISFKSTPVIKIDRGCSNVT